MTDRTPWERLDAPAATPASRFRRRSLFVVFTDLVESVVDDNLLPALRTLTRTHLVMVAAVRDPDVVAWASATTTAGPGRVADDLDASAAYRSAAAVASLDGRDRATAMLSAAGATVVDAEPGRPAVDVVDRYLEPKARGRL